VEGAQAILDPAAFSVPSWSPVSADRSGHCKTLAGSTTLTPLAVTTIKRRLFRFLVNQRSRMTCITVSATATATATFAVLCAI
jgi:hypothetical protein